MAARGRRVLTRRETPVRYAYRPSPWSGGALVPRERRSSMDGVRFHLRRRTVAIAPTRRLLLRGLCGGLLGFAGLRGREARAVPAGQCRSCCRHLRKSCREACNPLTSGGEVAFFECSCDPVTGFCGGTCECT
jgi:hypothetical protein